MLEDIIRTEFGSLARNYLQRMQFSLRSASTRAVEILKTSKKHNDQVVSMPNDEE